MIDGLPRENFNKMLTDFITETSTVNLLHNVNHTGTEICPYQGNLNFTC